MKYIIFTPLSDEVSNIFLTKHIHFLIEKNMKNISFDGMWFNSWDLILYLKPIFPQVQLYSNVSSTLFGSFTQINNMIGRKYNFLKFSQHGFYLNLYIFFCLNHMTTQYKLCQTIKRKSDFDYFN